MKELEEREVERERFVKARNAEVQLVVKWENC